MNYPAMHEEVRALRADRERVADLLSRYPDVTPGESAEILGFLRTGRHLDVGLLTSNVALKPKLDAFMEDHKAHFQVKWSEGVMVVAAIVAIIAIFWLVWEAFA
ncbi:MAG: hypothetical protein ACTHN4_02820 [Sphingomicrobium sp.]